MKGYFCQALGDFWIYCPSCLSLTLWAFLSLYPHSCSTSSLRQSTQGPILVVFMILFYFIFCLQELPKWTLQTLETFLGVLEKNQGFLTQYIFVFKQLCRTCASDFTKITFRTNLMWGLTLNVCCMVSYNQFNLSTYLPWVEYAHNSFHQPVHFWGVI